MIAAIQSSRLLRFRSSFNDFASKHGKDERYRGVDKLRDREDLFKEFVSELRRKEKEESKEKKEKVGHADVTVLLHAVFYASEE